MFSNQQMNISASLFDSYVAPLSKGKLVYQWTCPPWLSFTQCSIRTTSHTLYFNISHIDKNKFTFGVPHSMIVNVVSNNIKIARLIGFFIIHLDKDIMSYLKFSIIRKENKLNDNNIILVANFSHYIDSNLFEDIQIKWSTNKDVDMLNGNFLPTFLFKPNSYGAFEVRCKIIYKFGQPQEVVSEEIYSFNYSPPPSDGDFFVIPNRGTSLSTLFSMISKNWKSNAGNSPDSLTYTYLFLNKYGEFNKINYLPQSSSYNITYIPPTHLLSVLVQDVDKFTQFNYSVNITSSLAPDNISNITNLDEQSIANTFQVIYTYN